MLLLDHLYLSNISNTRDSVSSGYPYTEKRIESTCNAHRGTFGKIRGVWIAKETLSRVFDISSQSKKNEGVNGSRRGKIVRFGYPV